MIRFYAPFGLLVALDDQGDPHPFRLRPTPDGRVIVSPGGRLGSLRSGRYILALDPGLLYRRRLSGPLRSRDLFLSMAAQLFPFEPESTRYAAAHDEGGTLQAWACSDEKLEALIDTLPEPGIILPAPAEPGALTRVVQERMQNSLADLSREPAWILPLAPVATLVLVTVCILFLMAGFGRWQAYSEKRLETLKQEITQLEREMSDVIKRRQALGRMAVGLQVMQEFVARPEAALPDRLRALFLAVPMGTFLDEVRFANGEITVGGLGNNPKAWVPALEPVPDSLEIAPRPKIDRFTFRLAVPGNAGPGGD